MPEGIRFSLAGSTPQTLAGVSCGEWGWRLCRQRFCAAAAQFDIAMQHGTCRPFAARGAEPGENPQIAWVWAQAGYIAFRYTVAHGLYRSLLLTAIHEWESVRAG